MSLPNVLAEFHRFQHIANFIIHFQRLETLHVLLPQSFQRSLASAFQFHWSPDVNGVIWDDKIPYQALESKRISEIKVC